jgi:sugar transferase EpsL
VPRIFDILALLLISPFAVLVGLMVAIAVCISMGRPIFFHQARGGYKNSQFDLWKFRTMTDQRDEMGALLPDAQRITRIGNFLRSSSLDELPSLWNLAKGDIRLVGPRPFIAKYLPLYSEEQRRRHEVRPGITGWAQVNGRNTISWEEKFAFDVWYVDNRSFWLDMKILMMTAKKVFDRHSINAEADVPMPFFEGSKPE